MAAVLRDLARAVSTLPEDAQPAALDETLADLEFTSLEALLGALPPDRRERSPRRSSSELAGLKLAATCAIGPGMPCSSRRCGASSACRAWS